MNITSVNIGSFFIIDRNAFGVIQSVAPSSADEYPVRVRVWWHQITVLRNYTRTGRLWTSHENPHDIKKIFPIKLKFKVY